MRSHAVRTSTATRRNHIYNSDHIYSLVKSLRAAHTCLSIQSSGSREKRGASVVREAGCTRADELSEELPAAAPSLDKCTALLAFLAVVDGLSSEEEESIVFGEREVREGVSEDSSGDSRRLTMGI